MLALIVVLSLVTGGLSSVLCPTKVDPAKTVHLPHPTSCSKFLTCVGTHPVEQDCPAGLHWNVENSFCDYPRASGCSRGDDSDELGKKPFNSTAVANSICLPQSSRCPLNSNPVQDVIFLKHRDCRKFYACVSTQQVELSCPPELYWNSRACVCDYEVEAECEGMNRLVDDVPEEADEEQPEDAEALGPAQEPDQEPEQEQDQEPEQEADQEQDQEAPAEEPEQAVDDESGVRVRRAADSGSSSGNSGSSGSSSGSDTSSGSSGSGSSGSTAQSGAEDIRAISSIAVLAFTAAMSVL